MPETIDVNSIIAQAQQLMAQSVVKPAAKKGKKAASPPQIVFATQPPQQVTLAVPQQVKFPVSNSVAQPVTPVVAAAPQTAAATLTPAQLLAMLQNAGLDLSSLVGGQKKKPAAPKETWGQTAHIAELYNNNYLGVSVSSTGRIGLRQFFRKDGEESLIPTKTGIVLNKDAAVALRNVLNSMNLG